VLPRPYCTVFTPAPWWFAINVPDLRSLIDMCNRSGPFSDDTIKFFTKFAMVCKATVT